MNCNREQFSKLLCEIRAVLLFVQKVGYLINCKAILYFTLNRIFYDFRKTVGHLVNSAVLDELLAYRIFKTASFVTVVSGDLKSLLNVIYNHLTDQWSSGWVVCY